MGLITVIGLGPGHLGMLTLEAWQLLQGDKAVYLRTEKHPLVEQLAKQGVDYQSFDGLYDRAESFQQVYAEIVQELQSVASQGDVVYAVPGHPLVAETTVAMLLEEAANDQGTEIKVVPGMSFLDACYNLLQVDPVRGMAIQDGMVMTTNDILTHQDQLICQVYDKMMASQVKLTLLEVFPPEHQIKVITAAGVPELEQLQSLPLYELDRLNNLDYLTSIYVPALRDGVKIGCQDGECSYPLDPIVLVVDKLRGEGGCPWDREQTHLSMRKYLIEEAYEVVEAIDEKNMYKLCDELGDLLLQIVFHANIAAEAEEFAIQDVVEAITAKMVRRHPHVFGDTVATTPEQVKLNWDRIKQQEQQSAGESITSILSVPAGFPALMKSQKLQQQAAKAGFDWPEVQGVLDKAMEEWLELKGAMAEGDAAAIKEEFGDVVFSLVNLARFLKIDAEEALQDTCNKFLHRFRLMEGQAREMGVNLADLSIVELEKLWQKAKKG